MAVPPMSPTPVKLQQQARIQTDSKKGLRSPTCAGDGRAVGGPHRNGEGGHKTLEDSCKKLHSTTVTSMTCRPLAERSLTGKKSVPVLVFPKKPAGTPCAQPWLVAVGGWRLVAVGGWRLAVGNWRLVAVGGGWRRLVVGDWWFVEVGSGWQLAVDRRWWLAAVGGWRLVVGGWWQLAVDGSWRLVVGGPLGRSLATKKNLVP